MSPPESKPAIQKPSTVVLEPISAATSKTKGTNDKKAESKVEVNQDGIRVTLPVADKDEHGNMITKTTSKVIVDGPVDKNKIKVDI